MNEEYIQKSWVGGICIRDGKVLLVHRINKEDGIKKEYFVFPGKEVRGDETLESALGSAFKDFSITIKLGELLYSKEDEVDDLEYYYLCDYVLGEPEVVAGSNEAEEMEGGEQFFAPIWVELSDIDDLIVYPETVKNAILELTEDGSVI
jgi:ADP-ribose pyrophosphatase YjhB (NUDIX family)